MPVGPGRSYCKVGGGAGRKRPLYETPNASACVCVFSSYLLWRRSTPFGKVDSSIGITQEEGNTGVLLWLVWFNAPQSLLRARPFPSSTTKPSFCTRDEGWVSCYNRS